MSRTVELFLKLPLETVLRRGQVNVLRSPKYRMSRRGEEELETVVPIGEYRGVIGTMWCIAREEGVREVHVVGKGKGKGKVKEKVKKGQGIEGLWRGWRVGMWGLAGVWGAGLIGGGRGGDAGEF
jgi:fusion and transport protein UGO1